MAVAYDSSIGLFMMYPDIMADSDNIPHMKKLTEARNCFMSKFSTGQQNTNFESVYYDLYVEITENEDFWFSKAFPRGPEFSEWTVGILGTLATIRRQRGHVEKCLEILELDKRILDIYTNMLGTEAGLLTYKYNLIAVNANVQMKNKDAALKAFREAVTYEIEQNYSFDQQNLGWMLTDPGNVECEDYMTIEFLNNTSDDRIWSYMILGQEFNSSAATPSLPVEPWICDGCGSVESFCGDFKGCSGCKKAKYCSKPCQTKHWKLFHKFECKSSKKSRSRQS